MATYQSLARAIRDQVPVAVVTVIGGSGPVGAKMLVFERGDPVGALGLDQLEERVVQDARSALRASRSEMREYALEGDEPTASVLQVFIEAHVPPPWLIIVGAGHTSIPLASMARITGFRVTLIDAREAFARRERFPDVDEIVVEWPHEALTAREITSSTYVAVLTHDPKFEEPLIPVLLRSPARYIGVIGSRRTQIQRRERLRAEGFTDADLGRLSGPIGLDIGAVTPEEIALSILAEMVAREHGRPAGFLSEKLFPARQ